MKGAPKNTLRTLSPSPRRLQAPLFRRVRHSYRFSKVHSCDAVINSRVHVATLSFFSVKISISDVDEESSTDMYRPLLTTAHVTSPH